MPNRKRPSRKQSAPGPIAAHLLPDTIARDVDGARWDEVVRLLCEYFQLPDLTTRGRLKKVHNHFDNIYRKLDDAYTTNIDNETVVGGIVNIWAKMFADALLRDKLFKRGLVAKMIPVFDMPEAWYVGLQALTAVTHHGGVNARREIAKITPTLLRLLSEHPDNPKVIELATVTMAHAISATVGQQHPADRKLVALLDMRSVLEATMNNLRKPFVSHLMLTHAMTLVTSSTLHCHKEYNAVPSVVSFLVACLRSNDVTTRCSALGGLFRLIIHDSEEDRRLYDPQRIMAAVQRGFPENLQDIMVDYGLQRCDLTLILKTAGAYQKAMMKCAQGKDLYALGKSLADFILCTEFSIAEGMFQALNERTGLPETIDVG
ncbi:uncharacterized protein FIBRA_02760 [Fibroporia radiculosa]|uniref:Condensin complex subunit 1 C-terminal domain-containing protein n=1 Tax=Fibroporia radiculosa TaxID=599839 RepID=J4GN37_9APHY|nr:uncharacterized protein FIBRA_02760 [Fibroporia radiculosa]CCM00720.1 predicted protein [Fibroporia radiculosa]